MNRAAGFTLVELLAAMTAGSLLLVSLSWAVAGLGQQFQQRADPRAAELQALAPLLSGLLAEALPAGAAFEGDESRLHALVDAPMAMAAGGAARLTLEIRPDRDGESLWARFAPEAGGAAAEKPLATGYRDIRIDYAGEAEPGAPARLPRLIGFVFVDASGEERRISAAPRVDSDGRCRFDPISMVCR